MPKTQTSTQELQESFKWFEDSFSPALKQGIDEFWESDFELRFISLTTNEAVKKDFISRGETYFITQLSINPHHSAFLRISSDFVRVYLHAFLGSAGPDFKLTELSELEVRILNEFSGFLLKNVSGMFTPYDEIPKAALRDKGEYHLTFLARKGENKSSKIVLSVPKCVLSPLNVERIQNFTFEDFEKMSTFVNIKVGSTKMTLNDLKALWGGDIILLENSNIHKMRIKTGNIEKEFKVSPNPSLIIELDEEELDIEKDLGGKHLSDKNIWDEIQIEVSAEFKKVKMTLGELRQISSGLVVDLGPVFDTRISLVVEDKLVARGELIIINDHYGVKLEEIFASPAIETHQTQDIQGLPEAMAPKVEEIAPQIQEPLTVEEEFDYSDFENEE